MKKTTQGLRDVLFDELEKFLSGEVDHEHVRSVTKLTGAVLATVAKDLEAIHLAASLRDGRGQPSAVADLKLDLLLTGKTAEATH